MVDLLHFALADLVGRVADPAAGPCRVERRGQVEGVGEEIVTEQDRRLVAPLGVDGGGMAADHGLIEDVVVHERRRVDHLDDGRQNGMCIRQTDRTPCPKSRTRAGRSRFPSKVGAVVDQLLHERESAAQLVLKDPLGLGQLRRDGAYRSTTDCAGFPPTSEQTVVTTSILPHRLTD